MKKINLLGATGSIGVQTIDILREHPDSFQLAAVSAGRNIDAITPIITEFKPELVSVMDKDAATKLQAQFPFTKVLYGDEGLKEVACYEKGEVVVNAVVGSVGLKPTLEAIKSGKDIALANKETLVTAGHLVMDAVKKNGVKMLPVDSEHSAIFQSLQGEHEKNIERLIITASGGSFRNRTREELVNVTVEDALAHPNWSMGAKITIDSATMMNKGLEVIEAHWLFDIPYDNIDVLVHYESIIHSMVEFHDTSIMAQLGTPDMRTAIQYALTYPDRFVRKDAKRLKLQEVSKLNFIDADFDRYPMLRFAYEAGRTGGTMPTVMNAANEAAVGLFLDRKISFLDIEKLVEIEMQKHNVIANPDLETIDAIDQQTRLNILKG